ncbi:hypothetical protein K7G98_00270 [Saccharothrix sp. MB29]|nr:hypothetical protein [Saccharothrix sp. MB29]
MEREGDAHRPAVVEERAQGADQDGVVEPGVRTGRGFDARVVRPLGTPPSTVIVPWW